jgi:hypothetical protein
MRVHLIKLFVFGANLNAKNEHNDNIFFTTIKRHFEIYSFKGLKLTWQKSSDFREFILLSQFKPPKTIKYLNNNVCIVYSGKFAFNNRSGQYVDALRYDTLSP